MNITTEQEISSEAIASLFTTALEGGSNYWYFLDGLSEHLGTEEQIKQAEGKYWVLLEARLDDGSLSLPVYDLESPEDLLGVVTSESVQKALQTMYTDYPSHFKDFITQDDDAITGDVFFQLAVMGDVTFC